MKRLANIEFYHYIDEMWARTEDGDNVRICEESTQLNSPLYDTIESVYTEAFKALTQIYKQFNWNLPKLQYNVVDHFIRCNFGAIDNVKDIDADGFFRFEEVPCPMRGRCPYRNIICNPKVNTGLGKCEEEVLRLTYRGLSETEVAQQTGKMLNTVHNQKFRAFSKLGIHNGYELGEYVRKHNLFRD